MGQCCSNDHQQNLMNQYTEQYPKPQNPIMGSQFIGPPSNEGFYIDKLPKNYPEIEVKALRKTLGNFLESKENLNNFSLQQSQQIQNDISQCDLFQMNDDQSVYQGQWKNGQKHGIGILYEKNGTLYEGQFEYNQKCGYGRQLLLNSEYYIGEFKNNKFQGKGTFYYVCGKKYEGYFENGKKQGRGSMVWKDGQQYIGVWKNNQYAGNNIQNGKQKIKWKEGVPVESSTYKSNLEESKFQVNQNNKNEQHKFKNLNEEDNDIKIQDNSDKLLQKENSNYEEIHLDVNKIKERLLTEDSLSDIQFEDLTESVQKEMLQLKDSEMHTLFMYLEKKEYKQIVNIGTNMLKTYKLIQLNILPDYGMILYLVSLACINLGNNETAIFFLEQIDQIEINYPRVISRDILAATYGMLSNAYFQNEIDNPPRLQSFNDQTTNGTLETMRDYNNIYQGSLKLANLYGNKAREVIEKEEINFSVRSEVVINISVSFLESNPQFGYNILKEELKDIEQRYNNIKQEQKQNKSQMGQQRNTKGKLKLNNLELYENFMISGLTNLSQICLQLLKTDEGFQVSERALQFLDKPQTDQQKIRQKAIIYSNLCFFGLCIKDYENSIKYGESAINTDQYYHFAYRHLILAYCQQPIITVNQKQKLVELIKHIIKFQDFFPQIYKKINTILKQSSYPYQQKGGPVSNNLFSTSSQNNIIVNQNGQQQYQNSTNSDQQEQYDDFDDLENMENSFKIPQFGGPGNKLQQNQNIKIDQNQIEMLIKYFQKSKV